MKSIVIHFSETFPKVKQTIREYNNRHIIGRTKKLTPRYDLSKCLRQAHKDLLIEMIRIYANQLLNYEWVDTENLPAFQTNSKALGKVVGCDERTVRALIRRLLESGLIGKKTYQGRRRNYRLLFNPDILVLCEKVDPKKEIARIEAAEWAADKQEVIAELRKTSPQLETGDTINKIILSCGNVENHTAETGDTFTGDTRLQDLQQNQTGKEKEGGRAAARKNTRLQDQKGGAGESSPVPAADLHACEEYLVRLYSLILSTLYKRLPYMADSQSRHIKKYLFRQFIQVKPEEYHRIHTELYVRILQVEKFLDRNPNRFIPIPFVYFNSSNPKGFERTKAWFEEMKENTRKIQEYKERYRILMKAWGGFTRLLGRSVGKLDVNAYLLGRKEVKAKYGDMVRVYDYVTLAGIERGD